MVPIPLTCYFSWDIILSQILIMAILSIDAMISDSISQPVWLFNITISFVFLVAIDFLTRPKNNSLGANSGQYWGRNIQVIPSSIK